MHDFYTGIRCSGHIMDDCAKLSDFMMYRVAGKGTFGTVLKAVDSAGAKLALKIVPITGDLKHLEHIRNELECWRTLSDGCDHIIKLLNCHRYGSVFAFVMEPAICDVLKVQTCFARANSPMPLTLVTCLTKQALSGIVYMHSVGVIHRDIKPENMLIDASGKLMIADFGLSVILQEGQDTRAKYGTIEYMAPEMLAGEAYDFAVDIWALGICILEWVSGQNPLRAHTAIARKLPNAQQIAYLRRHINAYSRVKDAIPMDIDDHLIAMLQSFLSMDPFKRFFVDDCPRHHYTCIYAYQSLDNTLSRVPPSFIMNFLWSKYEGTLDPTIPQELVKIQTLAHLPLSAECERYFAVNDLHMPRRASAVRPRELPSTSSSSSSSSSRLHQRSGRTTSEAPPDPNPSYCAPHLQGLPPFGQFGLYPAAHFELYRYQPVVLAPPRTQPQAIYALQAQPQQQCRPLNNAFHHAYTNNNAAPTNTADASNKENDENCNFTRRL